MEIKVIEASQTYQLRHKILRPNQTLEDCKYPLDMESETLHLGAFIDNQLISIASFFYEQNPSFHLKKQYRLRGMATSPYFRNKRAGTSLITKAEEIMKEKNTVLWWCNARTNVSEYYSKLGLEIEDKPFDIEPIGEHVLMSKTLKS